MTRDNSDTKEVDKKERFEEITKDITEEIITTKPKKVSKKEKRSAAGKKAAETRKKNRGGKVKVTIEIDGKLNSGLDKVVKIDGATSRESAIETAIRQYLMQNRVLD